MQQTVESAHLESLTKFRHPFTCIISGMSQSGKTWTLTQILLNIEHTIDKPIDRIIYCYGSYLADTFKTLKEKFGNKFEIVEGYASDIEQKLEANKRNLIILDDLMADAVGSKSISDLFTRGSHHKNLSIFLLTQNIFQKGAFARTISLNAHYIIYFKNPRDCEQIGFLGRQMFGPKKGSQLIKEVYDDAMSKPHGYILLDFKQDTPDKFRLRTSILPQEQTIVYVPK
jgi:hypothetical protein